jgi:hypothetical protein
VPGRITVVREDAKRGGAPIREALLNRQSSADVELRFGSRPLISSDLLVAGADPSMWGHRSVVEVGKACGMSDQTLVPALNAWGLGQVLSYPTEELSDKQRKALACCCGMFLRSKVIVLDNPFASLAPEKLEPAATVMLAQTELDARVVILVGVDQLPACWAQSPLVVIAEDELPRPRKPTFSKKANDEVLTQVRSMLLSPRTEAADGNSIWTYPQSITESPTEVHRGEALRREAIANPVVPDDGALANWAAQALESKMEPSVIAYSPERKHRNLTRVSLIKRLANRLIVVRWLWNLKFSFNEAAEKLRLAQLLLPPAKRMHLLKRNDEKRFALRATIVVLTLVLIAFCLQ